jgi:quercetin dioxygenase-like cupin family protein
MRRRSAKCFLAAGAVCVAAAALAQQVESKGITSQLRLEEKIYGHLDELNGKYKLRASEVTIAPGGMLGPHHHAGPGMRYVAAGELTFVEGGKATVYNAGAFFYESGDIVHTAHNRTNAPVRIIFFEVLPVQWSGPSVMQPKSH